MVYKAHKCRSKLPTSHIYIPSPAVAAANLAEHLMGGILGGGVHPDQSTHQRFHVRPCKTRFRLHWTLLLLPVGLCQLSTMDASVGRGAPGPAIATARSRLVDHLHP